jgi:hypothetical protein
MRYAANAPRARTPLRSSGSALSGPLSTAPLLLALPSRDLAITHEGVHAPARCEAYEARGRAVRARDRDSGRPAAAWHRPCSASRMRDRAAVPITSISIATTITACLTPPEETPIPPPPDARLESDAGAIDLCEPEETECDGTCVDLDTNWENCGACGEGCDHSYVCTDGSCQCPSGRSACGGWCADLTSDSDHCSACGRACRSDQLCSDGACSCPPGLLDCDGRCVHPQSDVANCGACGVVCSAPDVCVSGGCGCEPSGGWFSRIERCGGRCIDVGGDRANCGGCGVHCPDNHTCVAAMCMECSGLLCDDSCVFGESDPNNCGSCSNRCDASSVCASGVCTPLDECPPRDPARPDPFRPAYAICDGRCVDLTSDTSHCGGCGIACAPGERCFITCGPS